MKKSRGRMILKIVLLLLTALSLGACGNTEGDGVSLSGIVEEEDFSHSTQETEVNESSIEDSNTSDSEIYVYVTGQVQNPGVYSVSENSRLYEVITLAGGFTQRAKQDSLNLAEKVRDGQQIHVMSKAEYKKMGQNACVDTQNKESAEDAVSDNGMVNINTATAEELMTLPGIGETKALAIIHYREEQGDFSSIEEIMQVSGIKEASFDKIKALIKIS